MQIKSDYKLLFLLIFISFLIIVGEIIGIYGIPAAEKAIKDINKIRLSEIRELENIKDAKAH
jgi:hypothetical protein